MNFHFFIAGCNPEGVMACAFFFFFFLPLLGALGFVGAAALSPFRLSARKNCPYDSKPLKANKKEATRASLSPALPQR